MKRTAYENFGKNAKKITVMNSQYKDLDGKAVWVDEENNVYELNFARLSKTWSALKTGYTIRDLLDRDLLEK